MVFQEAVCLEQQTVAMRVLYLVYGMAARKVERTVERTDVWCSSNSSSNMLSSWWETSFFVYLVGELVRLLEI